MQAYRTYTTITDPQQITLTNLPFAPGQAVEILILVHDTPSDDLGTLFKTTQALAQGITDADIQTEITAYRQSSCAS
jgi:hypothetical protein